MTTPLRARRALWTACLTLALVCGLSASAMAQTTTTTTTYDDDTNFNWPLSTSLMIVGLPSTTTAVIVCAPIPNACYITSFSLQLTVDISSAEVDTMRRFMQANARSLMLDVSVGGGDSVDDLAHMLRVPLSEHAQFAEGVRRHREQILPLLHDDQITKESARDMILVMAKIRKA